MLPLFKLRNMAKEQVLIYHFPIFGINSECQNLVLMGGHVPQHTISFQNKIK